MAVALDTDTGILCVVSSVQRNAESIRAEALSYRVYSICKKLGIHPMELIFDSSQSLRRVLGHN